ncbi:MAG: peptidase and in kexin sedolisin [Flavipsychrobacter sp.]|nr:peptidase and in kexin sedolisin [Flavipsychrobacter sp.]
MRRSICGFGLIIALLLLADTAQADQYAYQVTFTDKNNTPYSLTSPSAYLSSRAISRRAIQGIAIDSTDLPVDATYIANVLTLTGGKLHETSRWLNLCVILVDDKTQVNTLMGKPYISDVKLVGHYTTALHKSTKFQNSLALPANKSTAYGASYYSNTWPQTSMVHGEFLHNIGYTGKGKLIAVLDAGFIGVNTVNGFDSLRNRNNIADVYNFTYANSNVYNYDSHGTEVLSTMAGYVPGTYVGSAPDAMYALYVTEYNASENPLELNNLLSATERADSIGADIVTISLGYDIFDDPGDGQVFSDLDGKTTVGAKAANIATKKGMLFVATAGNEGTSPWHHILTPGDADSALTIGATDGAGNVAALSGYGPNAAGQVKPDVCAMGSPAYIINGSGAYASGNGTSFSTPQIAGWAACLWQGNPTATPAQLRQAIIKCASSYGSPDAHFGYGIPNFQCTEQVLSVLDTPPVFTGNNWMTVTPNPFSNTLTITASPAADQYVDFQMIDMTGKTLTTLHRYLYKGYNHSFDLSLPLLPAGTYILKAVSATQQNIIKLEKR